MTGKRRRQPSEPRPPAALIATALIVLVLAVFGVTVTHDFIAFDDPYYVTENAMVVKGLTARGVAWALTTTDYFYWHPLTWLSHMADTAFYGVAPGGHHLTNVVIHAGTTLLVFTAFCSLTRQVWRSAMVAALFAVHPLHVEPVAWIAERKELLAGFFWFAGVIAYAGYARQPSWRRYACVAACFTLALASKPVAVTFPFALLLLDCWPLGRWPATSAITLVVEKAALLVLSLISSVITYAGQSHAGAMNTLASVGWSDRIANAVTSYAVYVGDVFWPHPLAPLYPYNRNIPVSVIIGAALLLALITVFVIRRRQRSPYLLAGWLWFGGTLIPTIGLVQAGEQSHADRFMYLPIVGLFVMIVWAAGDWLDRQRNATPIAIALTAIAIAALAVTASVQTRYWHDSITLLQHTVDVTGDNPTALHNLGVALAANGRLEEAVTDYRRSLELRPQNPLGDYNLALALDALGRYDQAAAAYAEAVHRHPQYGEAQYGLGAALLQLNRLDAARASLETALQQPLDDEYLAQAHFRLGLIGAYQGDMARARKEFRASLQLRPDWKEARSNLEKTY